VHGIIIVGLIYFAAREGYLGKKIQKISVEMVKEKKPQPEKPKAPEKKIEPPKVEVPKNEPPKYVEPPPAAATGPAAPPAVAPPSADLQDFSFADGAKAVNSESDPVQLYKGYVEYTLRSKWNRPENLPDDNYVAEVKLNVDPQGNLSQPKWLKGSGDAKWDQSVKDVLKQVTTIGRRPPTNFPPAITIRFDVQEATEPIITP
jgi:outer membrane biosynthesis protein TonB